MIVITIEDFLFDSTHVFLFRYLIEGIFVALHVLLRPFDFLNGYLAHIRVDNFTEIDMIHIKVSVTFGIKKGENILY